MLLKEKGLHGFSNDKLAHKIKKGVKQISKLAIEDVFISKHKCLLLKDCYTHIMFSGNSASLLEVFSTII
jgi:hypothetical protein